MFNKNAIIDKALLAIPQRYELVILASQRARLLALGAQTPLENPPLIHNDIALQEIASGVTTRKSIIDSFKNSVTIKENDDIVENIEIKEIKEGVRYDDFDIDDSFDE